MITLMKNVNNFQVAKVQPGVAYKITVCNKQTFISLAILVVFDSRGLEKFILIFAIKSFQ